MSFDELERSIEALRSWRDAYFDEHPTASIDDRFRDVEKRASELYEVNTLFLVC